MKLEAKNLKVNNNIQHLTMYGSTKTIPIEGRKEISASVKMTDATLKNTENLMNNPKIDDIVKDNIGNFGNITYEEFLDRVMVEEL